MAKILFPSCLQSSVVIGRGLRKLPLKRVVMCDDAVPGFSVGSKVLGKARRGAEYQMVCKRGERFVSSSVHLHYGKFLDVD